MDSTADLSVYRVLGQPPPILLIYDDKKSELMKGLMKRQ